MSETPISRFWYISPLTRRILAVNVAALLVLVLGLLYTGQYERGLIASELDALQAKGQLLVSALSGSIAPDPQRQPSPAPDLARQILRGVAEGDGLRVLLFGKDGQLLVDSRDLPGGASVVHPAPAFPSRSAAQKARLFAEKSLTTILPTSLVMPDFRGGLPRAAGGWPGAERALRGLSQQDSWRNPNGGGLLLTAALPVRAPDGVIRGAVFLMHDGRDVAQEVLSVRLTVLRAFLMALLVTILLSIYLSETIVYPIVRLARATERVRQSILLKDSIPDLSWRKDEIGDLSRAFREMTFALDARIDSVSRFAADVAHEIKNPLASVKSAIETLAIVRDEAQRQKLLSVVNDDIDRLNRLITDISNASRLDSDLNRAERKVLDFAALIRNAVEVEGARLPAPGKIFLYIEEGRHLPVTGNDVQLAQVAHNLIDNALSFVAPGGIVTVSAGLKGDKVYMHVDNPGPPIPEDKLEAIFERFYSERPKTEKFGLHSGLGLSISRQIVRMHHGEITAQNLRNKSGAAQGVRFTVLLPAGPGTK